MTNELRLETPADLALTKDHLVEKWNSLESNPQVFRYRLNIRKQTILNGKFKFLTQVNPFLSNFLNLL